MAQPNVVIFFKYKPSYSTTVMQRNPGGASEAVPDGILYCHVCTEGRTIIYVGSLTERTVCTADVMMVTTDHYWCLGRVEGGGGVHMSMCCGRTSLYSLNVIIIIW